MLPTRNTAQRTVVVFDSETYRTLKPDRLGFGHRYWCKAAADLVLADSAAERQ
jgi:hypothetical protein